MKSNKNWWDQSPTSGDRWLNNCRGVRDEIPPAIGDRQPLDRMWQHGTTAGRNQFKPVRKKKNGSNQRLLLGQTSMAEEATDGGFWSFNRRKINESNHSNWPRRKRNKWSGIQNLQIGDQPITERENRQESEPVIFGHFSFFLFPSLFLSLSFSVAIQFFFSSSLSLFLSFFLSFFLSLSLFPSSNNKGHSTRTAGSHPPPTPHPTNKKLLDSFEYFRWRVQRPTNLFDYWNLSDNSQDGRSGLGPRRKSYLFIKFVSLVPFLFVYWLDFFPGLFFRISFRVSSFPETQRPDMTSKRKKKSRKKREREQTNKQTKKIPLRFRQIGGGGGGLDRSFHLPSGWMLLASQVVEHNFSTKSSTKSSTRSIRIRGRWRLDRAEPPIFSDGFDRYSDPNFTSIRWK